MININEYPDNTFFFTFPVKIPITNKHFVLNTCMHTERYCKRANNVLFTESNTGGRIVDVQLVVTTAQCKLISLKLDIFCYP